MIKILILQDNQTISRLDKNKLVSDSKDLIHVQVVDLTHMSDFYASNQVVFWHEDGHTEYVNIDPNTNLCVIPADFLTGGTFKIGIYSITNDDTIITTNRVTVDVSPSGYGEPESHPDAYSQLLCRVIKMEKKLEDLSTGGTSSIPNYELQIKDLEQKYAVISSSISSIDRRVSDLESKMGSSSVARSNVKMR